MLTYTEQPTIIVYDDGTTVRPTKWDRRAQHRKGRRIDWMELAKGEQP